MGTRKYQLPPEDDIPTGIVLKSGEKVSVSLKYWHAGSQCVSDWQRGELTKLRKLIEKVQGLTASEIRTDAGLQWKLHKGPAARGFSRPSALSKDIDLCELRVDSKARIHGAVLSDIFYLVWLDRSHAVFPDG